MTHPVESFFRTVRQVRDAGGVAETSFYPAIAALLDEAGGRLSPRVRCIIHPQNRGAGIPDGGLFTADQMGVGERSLLPDDAPVPAVLPARGALEVKGVAAGMSAVVDGEQVARYVERYGQVMVTNLREWVLVGRGEGGLRELERCVVAPGEGAFWEIAAYPAGEAARERWEPLMEFLRLAMLRPAPIVDPQEVAWILASYAKEARRLAESVELPALAGLREALEEALGMRFHGSRGEHFFRSTLVQTLFYGVFSAWVLWSRSNAAGRFDWRLSGWELRVPAIRALFVQIADRDRLSRLGLTTFLMRAEDALNRVDRPAFFARFQEEHAVQYFYEPFLQAFDPALRKELGVWYTPPEIVKYMVARVDSALRDELGIEDGLADRRVLVLDPCCGTGAYLVGVLERIAETLRERGEGDLVGAELRHAATERVFGFEILPAPFVVAHLQLGLLLRSMGAGSDEGGGDGRDRVGVFLTNALTGWGPPSDEQKALAFPELQAEHDAAEAVKRADSILVVLGNPPYNGFPGAAIDEERELVDAYRSTVRAPRPQGQGLNDLYVRFFRMAERRIVEMTGKGVVCFISNYSWLDGLSFTGMRERFLDVFDRISIDSLNGDKYRTGKLTPDGKPDPSVFSTEWNREGIQVGTAVSLLVRLEGRNGTARVTLREFWGTQKRERLVESLRHPDAGADVIEPAAELGFPFRPRSTAVGYLGWPTLEEVFPVAHHGVKTSRDEFVVDVDRSRLEQRMAYYFDPEVSDDVVRRTMPAAMKDNPRFDSASARSRLVQRGFLREWIVRHYYRPFDVRWIYWEPETKLIDEKRSEFQRQLQTTNTLYIATQKRSRRAWSSPVVTGGQGDLVLLDPSTAFIPLQVCSSEEDGADLFSSGELSGPQPNLSDRGTAYLANTNGDVGDLFHHCTAILHAPDYRAENGGALRQDWPRIPLPSDRVRLQASAALGRELATLLDPERPAPAVTTGTIRTELRPIGSPTHADGAQLDPDRDFSVTAGWGHAGKGGATMPGRGRITERAYTDEERGLLETGATEREMSADQLYALLGETCVDIWLNDAAYWRCVPARVWEYTLGGYQVIKKWLSYREQPLLGRPLTLDEVREVRNIARRIAAILLLEPALNEAYAATKADIWEWQKGASGSP